MKKTVMAGLAALGILAMGAGTALAEWKPAGPIKLTIAFKAGGGADTQARLIAEHMEQSKGWKVIPENITGKGGVNALAALKDQPADGTAIAMLVTESLGYNLAAAPKARLKPSDFTPLTTTAGFQMGLVAKTAKGWTSIEDMVAAAKSGETIRFGAMSPKLADLAYLLGQKNDIEFNIVMVRGGKGVMNGLNAGDIDIGFGAGIQNKAIAAGDMVNLASGLSTRLNISPDAPTLAELGVPFNADGYFVMVAPAGLPDDARAALTDAIVASITEQGAKASGMINKAFGGPAVIRGAELDALIQDGYDSAGALMDAAQ